MLVIVTCFASPEPFGFLTQRTPVAMLSCLNKPLLEHLLEQCADEGLTRIRIALVEHPRPVRQFVGNGERWGLDVHTWDFREPCSDEVLLARLAHQVSGPVLIIPAETLINLDLKALLDFHEQGPQHVTRVVAGHKGRGAGPGDGMQDTGIRVVSAPLRSQASDDTFVSEGKWIQVDNPIKLWEANTAALHSEFPRTLPTAAGSSVEPQWIGHHCRIDPRSTIGSPVFVGNHVSIGSGAEIKSGSIIGNGVIIDSHALVESSIIMDHTYIGSYINVVDRIASGKYVLNVKAGSTLKVDDPIIVSGLREKVLGPVARRFTDRVLALAFFVATCPIWVLKGLSRLVRGKTFFDVQTFVISDGMAHGSTPQWSSRATLLRFNNAHPFVSRLPGLWDVISGRLALVGIRPLSEAEMARLTEDWTQLRFESPVGLFTMLDALGSNDLDEDEKVVIENYYASTRRLSSDMRILYQSLVRLILSR